MTKSSITRDELNEVIATYGKHHIAHRMANVLLAAMDSEAKEPISFDEWSRKCALQITLCYPDFREKAQYIWDSARETQQPAPEYPEVLPCSVLLEPGLRFGKGIKTSTMLAALARRAVHESDMAALSPEEIAEFQARIEDFKALIAQPAPVVPDEKDKTVDADDHPLLWSFNEGWNACRAAMLQTKSLTCINPAPDLVSLQKKAESIIGNYPGIPDGSEHCPCCGKKLRRACSVEGCGGKHVAHGLCQKHYDMKRWEDPEQVERFREAGRRYQGKKKSTAATPQEPKP